MTAGRCDLQCGFGGVLPFDVRKIQRVYGSLRAQPVCGKGNGFELLAAGQMVVQGKYVPHGEHIDPLRGGRFGGVGFGQINLLIAKIAR